MTTEMFCYQCEQTAAGKACAGKRGVCGKTADTSNHQDALTAALVDLALAVKGAPTTDEVDHLVLGGLFTTITNVSFNSQTVQELTDKVRAAARSLDVNADRALHVDLQFLWEDPDVDARSLKSLILFGLRGMAAYAYHARVLGRTDKAVNAYFYEALALLGTENVSHDALLAAVLKVGEVNLACMALLDAANTGAYGQPVPVTVPLMVEKGPFIVVTGHDLKDLELLLEQTEGKGVNVYTHGEMLPAHGYPKLKAYKHLKGNFGTAWQNQLKEFDRIPGAVLFTTNCLMPPRENYMDRVFTTEVVSYPGLTHIGEDKNFSPVIEKALALGGYPEDKPMFGINGGATVTTGFAGGFVLDHAEDVVGAVKAGLIKHFFLVGGCDGAKPGRNYYTEFVKQSPEDTVILTLACGKFRFNDLDLGEIRGLPRIMDMGQCNDAYSAIRVAVALSEAFECGINDLPLTLVLSWYEQKAVCILLTLLWLGMKNIYLGPTLPAFVSPGVFEFLSENYGIRPISNPEHDLAEILEK